MFFLCVREQNVLVLTISPFKIFERINFLKYSELNVPYMGHNVSISVPLRY